MQIKPEYQAVDEYAEIASALVAKYPEIFPAIDVSQIRCVAVTNKSRGEKKKLWTITAVGMPVRMDCPFGWYVVIFMDDWVEMGLLHRQYLVASSLCAMPADGEEGKIFHPDLKDYAVMLRTFGVDYLDKPADEMIDLLKGDIKWIT